MAGVEVTADLLGSEYRFIAEYAEDINHDNVPDDEQSEYTVTLQPYTTSIYFGGENGEDTNGFPELELMVTEEGRPVHNDTIRSVTINGHKFEGVKNLDELFKAIYVYKEEGTENYHIINSDEEGLGHDIITVIAVRASAKDAFPGDNYYEDDGLLRDKNNEDRYVTVNSDENANSAVKSFGINADDESGNFVDYFVNVESGSLKVREVNNDADEVYRDIVADETAAVAVNRDDNKAAAVTGGEGTVFWTNGDDKRALADSEHIKLLVDDVKTDDNRIELLENRAYTEAYGMSAEEAKADGYDSELKYFDLVDSGNGNAWVQSSTGTFVYWPYPEGTDKNTEFTLRHFKGLDREKDYDGADAVAGAIEGAELDDENDLQMKKTDEGIRFYTTGEHAFSPFMLMWKTDDASSDDNKDDDDHGNGNTDSNTPGAGPGASGSTYTAGVHGNWVHVDPANIFAPITSPVPEGATPVTAPEWHQWKFILNNGAMLYDQWAYVKNPYAVDGQPKEGWFSFDNDGIMEYGWYLDENTGKWYWMHRDSDGMLGTMETGWHYDDQDGKWYYLNPDGGEMLLGWQQIGSAWYYFNPYAPEITWHYDEATGGWTWNGSASRPYGSMYRNEMTPDGYFVDENGAWRN